MREYYFFAGIFADVLMPEAYQHLNFHLQVFHPVSPLSQGNHIQNLTNI